MIFKGNRQWRLLTIALLTVSVLTFLYYGFGTNITGTEVYRYIRKKQKHSTHPFDNMKTKQADMIIDDFDLEKELNMKEMKIEKPKKNVIVSHDPVLLTRACPKLGKPSLEAKDKTFQLMPERNIYVYSAYYDIRDKPNRTIRVSGFSPAAPIPFYCQLYYKDGAVFSARGMAFDFSTEQEKGRNRRSKFPFKSHWYICDEPRDKAPVAVSLTPDPCFNKITNLVTVQVRKMTRENKIQPKVLVCVKTLYDLKSPYRLIEFLEYQRMFGASNVAIYDYDKPSESVKDVISYYTKQGFLKTIPWKLPLKTSKHSGRGVKIRTYGQRTQINDCIYRFMLMYKYIVIIDMDEFLVPVKDRIQNYTQLVNDTMARHQNHHKNRTRTKREATKLQHHPLLEEGQQKNGTRTMLMSSIKNGTRIRQMTSIKNRTRIRQMTSVLLPHVDFCLTPEQAFSLEPDSLLFSVYRRSQPPLGRLS